MRIREVADLLRVEPHVLRHWEDMGVVRPPRAANGYRDDDEETVDPSAHRSRVPRGWAVIGADATGAAPQRERP